MVRPPPPRQPDPMEPPPEQASAWTDTGATLKSPAPPTDDELAIRCLLDTAERTALGIWIYPIMWLSVAIMTGAHLRWPVMIWGNVGGLLCMGVVRSILNRDMANRLRTRRVLTETTFQAMTMAIAGYWGILTSLSIHHAPGEGFSWIMLTLTVAFCAGGNTLFGINPSLRLLYPLAMIVPVVMAQALQPTVEQRIMMGLEIVLTIYLRRSSGIVQKDYWDARLAQRLSAQQARELELASLTDGLTGLPNRTYFDRQYAHEWARQCRHGGPVSLMLVDLDHFKQVNDTHGHPFGDACLREVAKALRAGCGRSTDFVARYGGEEFVVLLAETDSAGAQAVAQRMLEEVRAITLRAGGQPVPLTCSIGLATMRPHHATQSDSLLHEADRALYRAKRAGRNQVALTDGSSEPPPARVPA